MTSDAHKNLLRLYVSRETILSGENAELSESQHHYLRNVMRQETGARLRVFNGRNGEWLAEIKELNKKKAIVTFVEKIREQEAASDVFILASPVKKEAFDFMIEKSCELGAAKFIPVQCSRTVVTRVNQERLQLMAIEAAEQCERLDIMQVEPLAELQNTLKSWVSDRKIIYCMERKDAPLIGKALQTRMNGPKNTPIGLLIGPEGGFTDSETRDICALPFVTPVSLGPRILKAETALIAALACIQLA